MGNAGACTLVALLTARRLVSTATAPASHAIARVMAISDAQLLALFADRPVALIDSGNQQTAVFLDAPHASGSTPMHE